MSYEQDILNYRQEMEDRLRSENGWLTVVGLYWLHEGENMIGSAPDCDVILPAGSVPDRLGMLRFENNQAILTVMSDAPVEIDGVLSKEAVLRDDWAEGGPSYVILDSVTFFVIKRGDQYGIRVRDQNALARLTFGGRQWFPINRSYCVEATFTPHETPRTREVVTSAGIVTPMQNVGYVEFTIAGQQGRLEAFETDENNQNELWFVFRDATSGRDTYKGGRFLYAPFTSSQTVMMDFNKARHPPCAFTAFATCPLPLKENTLTMPIEAGERYPTG